MKLVNLDDLAEKEKQALVLADGVTGAMSANQFVVAQRPEKLDDVVKAIRMNDCVHFVTDGSFSLHDLLLKMIHFYPGAEVWITTYSFTELPARILADMVATQQISKLHVLGDRRIRDRYPAVEQLMSSVSEIKTTQIHGKVLVLKCGDEYLTIVGSANWTTNPRIEIGVADKSKNVAMFHIDWITKKMNDADIFGRND